MKQHHIFPPFGLSSSKKYVSALLSLWAFLVVWLWTMPESKAQNPQWQIEEREDRNINGKIFSFGKVNRLKAILPEETDMISELAKAAGIEVVDFLKYNDLNVSAMVENGQVYYLEPKHKIAFVSTHVLTEGETLWQVSQRYGIELKRLYYYNRLDENAKLEVGTVLWLQSRRPKNVPVEIRTIEATRGIVLSRVEGENARGLGLTLRDTTKKTHLAEEDPELSANWQALKEEGFIGEETGTAQTTKPLDTLVQKTTQSATLVKENATTAQTAQTQTTPEKAEKFENPEKKVENSVATLETREGYLYYTTQTEAERLDNIANQHKAYVADLRLWNKLSADVKTFPKGTKLIVGQTQPKKSDLKQTATASTNAQTLHDSSYLAVPDTKVQGATSPAHLTSQDIQYHYVQKGETIWKIAQYYNLDPAKLIEWNQLGTGDRIDIGQRLVLKPYLALPKTDNTTNQTTQQNILQIGAKENTRGLGNNQNTAQQTTTQSTNPYKTQSTAQNTTVGNTAKPTREEILKVGGNPDKAGTKGYDSYGFEVATAEPEKPLLKVDTVQILLHTVGEKETLWTIAKKFGVSSGDLVRWNKLQDNGILHQGTKLIVRGGDALPTQLLEKHKAEQTQSLLQNIPAPNSKGEGLHVVQKGETIYHVAKRYHLTPDQIIAWNALPEEVIDLNPGETLIVAQPQLIKANPTQEKNQEKSQEKQTVTDSTKKRAARDTETASAQNVAAKNEVWVYHTVVSGDTLNKIALLYGVSKDQIRQWNEMKDDIVRLDTRLIVGKK
jgi:LysM repeat protein